MTEIDYTYHSKYVPDVPVPDESYEDAFLLTYLLPQESGQTCPAGVEFVEIDLAWAAGFLEGEGSFGVTSFNKNGSRGNRITCRQVNVEPLRRLMKIFGGTLVFIEAPSQRKARISEWRCSGMRARIIMRLIFPQMSRRRQKQISDAILATRKDG